MRYQRGTIQAISDLEQVRRPKMSDIFKRYITVKLYEKTEIVHLEIRNSGLKLIDHLDLKEGSEILFTYEFQGITITTKQGDTRLINNIVLTQIKNYRSHSNQNSNGKFQRDKRKPLRFSR